ncbi:hypothetical protein Spa11_00710 [Botrimarina mediterranea]|uniref:Glycosyltransferase RgtA/B/C/D-like domain-containing protein n=1 Tax=Botrimarina mediterranea TaxID=2528022 RepID=A0A518K299_9BACT|nr:hypothetical protein Spa11_00710 [Botrimarina mediterranea]
MALSNRMLRCGRKQEYAFEVVSLLLRRRQAAHFILVLLLAAHTTAVAYNIFAHSPTVNEPAHLAAGLAFWHLGRLDLYEVNPPFVRCVAALPILLIDHEVDWAAYRADARSRSEFAVGADLVHRNAGTFYVMLFIARLSCLPFTIIGAVTCYAWASDLSSRTSGLLAATLWCTCPNILGYSATLFPDSHASAVTVAAAYLFWKWLRNPSWPNVVVGGIVLGIADLCKFTTLGCIPAFLVSWLVYRLAHGNLKTMKCTLIDCSMMMTRLLVALAVVNAGYLFEGTLQPLSRYKLRSEFSRNLAPPPVQGSVASEQERTALTTFAECLQHFPIPLPQSYIRGMDSQQVDFENYGRPFFMAGRWSETGFFSYYIYALTVKTPTAGIFLFALACARRVGAFSGPHSLADDIALLSPAFTILLIASVKTGINEHFRYILQVLPFGYVFIASACFGRTKRSRRLPLTLQRFYNYAQYIPRFLVVWFVVSSIWVFPHSLSYFNELVGGPRNGRFHLLGTAIDCGQDHFYVEQWLKTQPAQDCFVALFAFRSPASLLQSCATCDELASNAHGALSSVIVSANILGGMPIPVETAYGVCEFYWNDLNIRIGRDPRPLTYSTLLTE